MREGEGGGKEGKRESEEDNHEKWEGRNLGWRSAMEKIYNSIFRLVIPHLPFWYLVYSPLYSKLLTSHQNSLPPLCILTRLSSSVFCFRCDCSFLYPSPCFPNPSPFPSTPPPPYSFSCFCLLPFITQSLLLL